MIEKRTNMTNRLLQLYCITTADRIFEHVSSWCKAQSWIIRASMESCINWTLTILEKEEGLMVSICMFSHMTRSSSCLFLHSERDNVISYVLQRIRSTELLSLIISSFYQEIKRMNKANLPEGIIVQADSCNSWLHCDCL